MLRLILVILMTLSMTVFTDEMIGVIVDNFNSKNFSAIYQHFDSDLKKAISREVFNSQMAIVRNRLGIMQDYMLIDTGKIYFICEDDLDTGIVSYELNSDDEFKSFYIKYQPKSTFRYLVENKNNSKVALTFSTPRHNFSQNGNTSLSVCSVYKITLVVEYARQVIAKLINQQECIDLSQINKYFMPHVDNGHAEWLKSVKKTCATYQEMVVGMIYWSSNAIAEFLTDVLTPKKVDELITKLNLNHSKTLYVVSSMFAMNNTYNLPRPQWLNMLRLMKEQQIRQISEGIHQKLKNGSIDINKDSFYLDPDVIDIHVQLLQRSTSNSYYQFMKIINNNLYLDTPTLALIKLLFDQVSMSSNFVVGNFVHAGAKGGSASYPGMTNAALAVSGYAETGTDVLISYSFLMNGLRLDVFAERLADLNLFVLALETSQFYVSEFIKRMEKVKREEEGEKVRKVNLREIQQ